MQYCTAQFSRSAKVRDLNTFTWGKYKHTYIIVVVEPFQHHYFIWLAVREMLFKLFQDEWEAESFFSVDKVELYWKQ